MNKGIIYCTKIREEYEGAHMEHMIAEKLLEIALKKEYGINLYNEPRAEGEHGKPFLSYRPSLHYNISHSGKYVVCILADQEVGIDVQCVTDIKLQFSGIINEETESLFSGDYDEVVCSVEGDFIFCMVWLVGTVAFINVSTFVDSAV